MKMNESQNENISSEQIKSENFVAEKEIRKVLAFPKEERKNALAKFKKRLAEQENALADCRNVVESEVVKNPDISKEKLLSVVDTFSEIHGFGEKQRDTAERLIDSYYRYRENMKEICNRNNGNACLVARELTGVDCKQDSMLEMEEGIMSVNFFADNLTARRMRGEKDPDPDDRIMLAGFKEITKGKNPLCIP